MFDYLPTDKKLRRFRFSILWKVTTLLKWVSGSAEYIHIFTEAKKLAFEDRTKFYADMDFYETLSNGYFQMNMQMKEEKDRPNKVALSQLWDIKDGDDTHDRG